MNDDLLGRNISYMAISGTRLPDGRLEIGGTVFDDWPASFELLGTRFDWTEEDLSESGSEGNHDVLGFYFRQ
jgi:hypothetical protein